MTRYRSNHLKHVVDYDTNNENIEEMDNIEELSLLLKNMSYKDYKKLSPREKQIFKKEYKPKLLKNPIPKQKPKGNNLIIVCIIILVAILGICYYLVRSPKTLDLIELRKELKNIKMHNKAVNAIISSLEKSQSKIIVLIGPSGVGKTYIGELISHQYSGNFHFLKINSLVNTKNFSRDIHHSSVIVLDDLRAADIDKFINFVQKLPKDIKIFILALFNNQYTDNNLNYSINGSDVKSIKESLKASELVFELFELDQISYEVAFEWSKEQVKKILLLEDEKVNHIVDNVLKNHDIEEKGLKGLEAKMMLEVEKYK